MFFLERKYGNSYARLFIFALIASVVVYFYELTNFSLSIDEEYAFVSWPRNGMLWWIALGRWGAALLDFLYRVNVYTPGLTNIIMLVVNALTASMLAIYTFKSKSAQIVFAVLFVSFPQFAYQAEFSQQSDTVAIGQFLSCLSGLVLYRSIFKKEGVDFRLISIGIALLTYSIGIYQSLISCAAIVFIMQIIINKENFIFSKNIIGCIKFLVASIVSVILYYIISLIAQKTFNVVTPEYLHGTFHWLKEPVIVTATRVLDVITSTLSGKYYYGASIIPLIFIPIVVSVYKEFKDSSTVNLRVFLILLIVFCPFAITVALGGIQGPRVLIGLSISFAFYFSYIIDSISEKREKVKNIIAIIVCLVIVYYSSSVVNKLFYSDVMARTIDTNISNRILTGIQGKYGSFNPSSDQISFVGTYDTYNPWRENASDTFGQSFFKFSNNDPKRMAIFMSLVSGVNIKLHIANQEEKDSLASLPSWPNSESIKLINGIYYVKLGD